MKHSPIIKLSGTKRTALSQIKLLPFLGIQKVNNENVPARLFQSRKKAFTLTFWFRRVETVKVVSTLHFEEIVVLLPDCERATMITSTSSITKNKFYWNPLNNFQIRLLGYITGSIHTFSNIGCLLNRKRWTGQYNLSLYLFGIKAGSNLTKVYYENSVFCSCNFLSNFRVTMTWILDRQEVCTHNWATWCTTGLQLYFLPFDDSCSANVDDYQRLLPNNFVCKAAEERLANETRW